MKRIAIVSSTYLSVALWILIGWRQHVCICVCPSDRASQTEEMESAASSSACVIFIMMLGKSATVKIDECYLTWHRPCYVLLKFILMILASFLNVLWMFMLAKLFNLLLNYFLAANFLFVFYKYGIINNSNRLISNILISFMILTLTLMLKFK